MIVEDGPQGRQHAFADGVSAYVAVSESGPDRWCYTIGRRSQLIDFDVVSGSPRVAGSTLDPATVAACVAAVVAAAGA